MNYNYVDRYALALANSEAPPAEGKSSIEAA
jgi:hypothetical protein